MSSFNYLIRNADEAMPWREMKLREYDVDSERKQDGKPDDPAGKIVPAAPTANLVITRPDSLSLANIESFFFKINVSGKLADLENPNPFQQAQAKDGAANVVQSTALQFNDVNGAGVLFASNGAPESLSDRSDEMRSLLEQNSLRNRLSMI
ncbi:hypothetical protein [Noviherbaspirillum soli]|uniref:hypothetical protein n=1 Tax=Noviherbaspirillum soli TaxID=1064518 RepID=UPI00188D3CFD|nr:hypothetical protein [Noviherbaspirillum soli]